MGMITQIPLDYMHLICLGIVKKLLLVWVEGSLPYRLSAKQIELISAKLRSYKAFIPSNFSRKSRGLNELKHWKATEFKTFSALCWPICVKENIKGRQAAKFFVVTCSYCHFSKREIVWIGLISLIH